jgi:hypothetical protein
LFSYVLPETVLSKAFVLSLNVLFEGVMHKAYLDFTGILGLVVAAIMMTVGIDVAEPGFIVVGGMVLVMVVLVAFIKSRLPR